MISRSSIEEHEIWLWETISPLDRAIRREIKDQYSDVGLDDFAETLSILTKEVASLKSTIQEVNKLEKASVELDNEMTM
jgi:hypothetical protein